MSCGSRYGYGSSEHGHDEHDYEQRLYALQSMMHKYMKDQKMEEDHPEADEYEEGEEAADDGSMKMHSPWYNMPQTEDSADDEDMNATISNFHDLYRDGADSTSDNLYPEESESHSPYADKDWMHNEEDFSSADVNTKLGDVLNNLDTVELYHVWRNLNEPEEDE